MRPFASEYRLLAVAWWPPPRSKMELFDLKGRVAIEIKGAAVYLASDASSFVTGTVLAVHGGVS